MVEGNAVMLKCSSQGIPNPKITWSRNSHRLTPSRRIRILRSGALQISEARRRDHGQYTCRAQNKVGYITRSARLVIKSKSIKFYQFYAVLNSTGCSKRNNTQQTCSRLVAMLFQQFFNKMCSHCLFPAC